MGAGVSRVGCMPLLGGGVKTSQFIPQALITGQRSAINFFSYFLWIKCIINIIYTKMLH